MNWRPILVHLAWLAALAVVVEIGTVWVCSRWFWTPLQRHYLSTFIWCSMPVIAPDSVEVHFIWKTGRHRKRDLATDNDVVSSENGTGMALSQFAGNAGWKRLTEGPPLRVPTAVLRRGLAGLAFAGESLWNFLLLPEACGVVAFGDGFYGFLRLVGRLEDWAAELSWKRQRSPWEEPSLGVFDECTALSQQVCAGLAALHRSALRRIQTPRAATSAKATVVKLPTRPASFAFPLFGVYNGTGEGYLWSERDEIE